MDKDTKRNQNRWNIRISWSYFFSLSDRLRISLSHSLGAREGCLLHCGTEYTSYVKSYVPKLLADKSILDADL